MVVKEIDLVHHIIDRYGKITETDRKENQKIFDEALDTNMPIDKYIEKNDDCIQYADGGKHPYTVSHIINNAYNMVLSTGFYTEPIKM